MEGSVHAEHHSFELVVLDEFLNGLPCTGNYGLLLRIKIGRIDLLPAGCQRLDLLRCGKYRHHSEALLLLYRCLHCLPADIHQLQPFFIGHCPGNGQRGKLPQTVAKHIAGIQSNLLFV
ncbi:hypothetical protein D3C75_970260 [compost metagenome]